MTTTQSVIEHLAINQYNIIAQMIFATVGEDNIAWNNTPEGEMYKDKN